MNANSKKLSPMRGLFVAEYLVDLNGTQAAIRAGYSPRTAKAQGSRLLTCVDVSVAVQAAFAKRGKRTELSQDWVIQELKRIVDECEPSEAKSVRALELLGKHLGMFPSRVEHGGEVTIHEQSDFDREIAALVDEMAARAEAPALCASPNGEVASNGKKGAATS